MIGPIIADLAAWTYEHDEVLFYRQLIPDEGIGAELSVFGHAYLEAASKNLLYVKEQVASAKGRPADGDRYYGQWLMWWIVCAWTKSCAPADLPDFYCTEKEEYYAKTFVTELIQSLLEGKTKSEAYNATSSFKDISKHWKWRTIDPSKDPGSNLITYVIRAWDSFYRGFDFTSSIHNAMKWNGNRHLTAMITGAFASAMYGCQYSYIKSKYASGRSTSHYINLMTLAERNYYHHALTMELANFGNQQRSFFPKNNALTNVDLHFWKSGINIFKETKFTDEEARRIFEAFTTDWEHRYGLYLDNGKVYCYRSNILLCRFTLVKERAFYEIRSLELPDDTNIVEAMSALLDAFRSCRVYKPEAFEAFEKLK